MSPQRATLRDRLLGSLRIEPDEVRPTLLLSSFLMLGMATVICLKTASDSVLLSSFDAEILPYLDLAVTLLVGLVVNYYLSRLRIRPLTTVITFTQVFLATALVLFFVALEMRLQPAPIALYLFVGVFAVLIPSQVWSLASLVFNTRQAKRVFSLVGSGGIAGAFLGGSFAGFVGPRIGAEALLPAAATFVLIGAALARAAGRRAPEAGRSGAIGAKERAPILESFELIRGRRYLLLITLAIFASTVVGTLIKYQFKAVAQIELGADRDALTSFLGYFTGYIAVFSLLFHMLFTSRLLRGLGLSWCLFLLPFSLAFGAAGLLVSTSLLAAILARGADQGLRHSIDRAAIELLYVPVPDALRNKVKAFLDMVVGRSADGVASLILLALLTGLQLEERQISWVSLGFIAFWMATLVSLRGEYLKTLRSTIERPDISAEMLLQSLAESGPTKEIENSLQSSDPRDVEAALGWIQFSGPGMADTQLANLLTHASPAVRRKALAVVASRDLPGCEREAFEFLRLEPDLGCRWRALDYLDRHGDARTRQALAELLSGDDRELAATVAARLARGDGASAAEASALLERYWEQAMDGDGRARATAARLLGLAPQAERPPGCLRRLLNDHDPGVVRAALRSAAELQPLELTEPLMKLLADRRFAREAREALAGMGPQILDALSAPLRDPAAPTLLQQQVARTLGLIGGRESARYLLAYLRRAGHGARAEALRALRRIRRDSPDVEFDRDTVNRLLEATLERYFGNAFLLNGLRSSDGGDAQRFLTRALRERMRRGLDEAFTLLGLIYPLEEIRDAHYRIQTGRADLRSNAVEFLDSRLLGHPQRLQLLAALEAADSARLIEAGRQLFDLTPLPYASCMQRLLDRSDPWLQACACAAAAESGLRELASPIRRLVGHADTVLDEAARAALRRLEAAWKN